MTTFLHLPQIAPLAETHPVLAFQPEDLKLDGEFHKLIGGMDRDKEMITFLLRCDSIQVFRSARAIAHQYGINVTFEVLDDDDPIKFGLGGSQLVSY